MASSDRFRFDLEKALATWRHVHARRRVFLKEDLDELERHLRDHVAYLMAGGLDEEAAFREAVRALGDLDGGEAEYRKVRWGKLRRRGQILSELQWRFSMLKNYLTVALRNLRKHRGYSFINVAGLSAGLACVVLIALFVRDELAFDRFHEHADRIYRVLIRETPPGGGVTFRNLMPPDLAPAMAEAFPTVEHLTRVVIGEREVRLGTDVVPERLMMVDSMFFDVFTFPLLAGDPATALDDPQRVVLSEPTARKYFGASDAGVLGSTLTIEDGEETRDFTVAGVLAPIPSGLQREGATR